jgi:hypothetical protein
MTPGKCYPGARVVIMGVPYIVVGVRRYLESAKRLAEKESARWTVLGSVFVVIRPAESTGTMAAPADNPAMREAFA